MSDLATSYDAYYSPAGGASEGISSYLSRFGDYKIPATEIILITTLLGRSLAKKAGLEFGRGKNAEEIGKMLQEKCDSEPNIHPEKLYRLIIEATLSGLQAPPPRKTQAAIANEFLS